MTADDLPPLHVLTDAQLDDLRAEIVRLRRALGNAKRRLRIELTARAPFQVGDIVEARLPGRDRARWQRATIAAVDVGLLSRPSYKATPFLKDGTPGRAMRYVIEVRAIDEEDRHAMGQD